MARWFRWSLSVADPFVCRCLTSSAMLPFPHPAHRTGRADLPHPALGEDSRNRRKPLHVTPSATSENSLGVVRLIANLPFCRRFLRPPSTEAPSLCRSYPASSVLRASPPSQSAQPVSHELPVDPYCNHRWDFPCCAWSPLPACRRQYPGRSDGIIRSYDSISFGLPRNRGGSAPALVFSRPAQRSIRLRPARSPSRLTTLCTRGFSSFVASTTALIATGWSEPVPGRVYPRCGPSPFHGAPGNRLTGHMDMSEAVTASNAPHLFNSRELLAPRRCLYL